MSETQPTPDTPRLNAITGEAPGIREILERRSEGMPDTPSPKPVESATAPPAEDDATRAAAELAQWRRRATEAEAGRSEAERARQAAEAHAARASQGAEDTGFTAVVTALGAAKQEIESLKTELKMAGEAGDFGRLAEIQVRLGRLGAEEADLERGKNEYERQRETRLRAPPPQPQTTGTASERTILAELRMPTREAFLATRTSPTAEFLRANPEFFTDEAAFRRMTGADALARGRGIAVDSPEYFTLIKQEAALSDSASSPTHRPTDPPRETTRPAPPAAAGPSREAPGPSGRATRSGDVYVSPEDKTAAEWLGVDPAEYASEKQRLAARGEYPYRRR